MIIDLNFQIHPIRKDINRHIGDMAVINSVKNLILTGHYERPFQPDLGSNIRRLLFENMDTVTATAIEREITQTLENFEPRVNVSRAEVRADFDNNGFSVYLEFFVQNRTEPISIQFFLERVR